ncbi:MAG: HPr family phosphocarrier protein [Hyphomonadaceae bacterium]|nr:HPr family phosphocarrier protein [Hyphomonadaceae bacterium]MBC6412364.1 HPr family phosphocarrier protein [Hyphomonadaceae bacterium]
MKSKFPRATVPEASARVTLGNRRGLHARAANKLFACANRFDAVVTVTSHNDVCAESVVADSVMELLLLGSACGEDITLNAKGPEADEVIAALVALIEGRFGEEP